MRPGHTDKGVQLLHEAKIHLAKELVRDSPAYRIDLAYRHLGTLLEIVFAELGFCHWRSYPRFLSGRGFIAVVLVRGETTEVLNSSSVWMSRSFFAFRSFDSLRTFCAALAALLGRFAFAIKVIVDALSSRRR